MPTSQVSYQGERPKEPRYLPSWLEIALKSPAKLVALSEKRASWAVWNYDVHYKTLVVKEISIPHKLKYQGLGIQSNYKMYLITLKRVKRIKGSPSEYKVAAMYLHALGRVLFDKSKNFSLKTWQEIQAREMGFDAYPDSSSQVHVPNASIARQATSREAASEVTPCSPAGKLDRDEWDVVVEERDIVEGIELQYQEAAGGHQEGSSESPNHAKDTGDLQSCPSRVDKGKRKAPP